MPRIQSNTWNQHGITLLSLYNHNDLSGANRYLTSGELGASLTGTGTGGVTGGVFILDQQTTSVLCTGTTEQTVYSYTVPANTLAGTTALRLTVIGNIFDPSSVDTSDVIRVKYGNTVVFSGSPTQSAPNDINEGFFVQGLLGAANATTQQFAHTRWGWFTSNASIQTADADFYLSSTQLSFAVTYEAIQRWCTENAAQDQPLTVTIQPRNFNLRPTVLGTVLEEVSVGTSTAATMLDVSTPAQIITGTTAEQTVYTYTVPANTLTSGTALRLRLLGSQQSSAAGNVAVRAKYGNTVLFSGGLGVGADGRDSAEVLELFIAGASGRQYAHGRWTLPQAAASQQTASGQALIGGGNPTVSAVHVWSAEDATVAQPLTISLQHDVTGILSRVHYVSLESAGPGTGGNNIIASDTTLHVVSGTATQTVFSTLVPANTLSPTTALRLKLIGDIQTTTAATDGVDMTLTYGGATTLATGRLMTGADNANLLMGMVGEAFIKGLTSSTQAATWEYSVLKAATTASGMATTDGPSGCNQNTGVTDSTQAQLLTLTLAPATFNTTMRVHAVVLEQLAPAPAVGAGLKVSTLGDVQVSGNLIVYGTTFVYGPIYAGARTGAQRLVSSGEFTATPTFTSITLGTAAQNVDSHEVRQWPFVSTWYVDSGVAGVLNCYNSSNAVYQPFYVNVGPLVLGTYGSIVALNDVQTSGTGLHYAPIYADSQAGGNRYLTSGEIAAMIAGALP